MVSRKINYGKKIAYISLDRFKVLHKLNIIKRKSGIISKAELLTSEVEITNKQKFLKGIHSKIKIEMIKLKSILEMNSEFIFSLDKMKSASLVLGFTDEFIVKSIKNGLLTSRLNMSSKLSETLLEITKEATKSNLDLFISLKSFGRGADFSESLGENSADKYEVYAGVSWEFDLGGAINTSEVEKVLSKKKQAQLRKIQLDLKLQNIFKEVKTRIISNTEQIFYLEKIKKQQKKILKAEKKRFKNGKTSTLDFVKLQEAYDRSHLQIIGLNYSNEVISLALLNSIGRMDLYLKNYRKIEL